jgi:hypothetical protein
MDSSDSALYCAKREGGNRVMIAKVENGHQVMSQEGIPSLVGEHGDLVS